MTRRRRIRYMVTAHDADGLWFMYRGGKWLSRDNAEAPCRSWAEPTTRGGVLRQVRRAFAAGAAQVVVERVVNGKWTRKVYDNPKHPRTDAFSPWRTP
jgi:hypothetical protein